jgi:hypothetical protein
VCLVVNAVDWKTVAGILTKKTPKLQDTEKERQKKRMTSRCRSEGTVKGTKDDGKRYGMWSAHEINRF